MAFKAIFTGQLDFGTQRSYEQVLKMFQWRVENYYRTDVLLKEEDIFDEETKSLIVGKFSASGTKKSWRNTYLLLDYVAQFAVAGNMGVWLTEEGTIKKQMKIEPSGDRATVQLYKKGIDLLEKEMYTEAIETLTKCVKKYPKHYNAFESRGYAYRRINDLDNAIADFEKSVKIYEGNAQAHFALGEIYFNKGELKEVIKHFANAIKHAIPHEPLYWTARYYKGDAHATLGEFDKAATEYRFFCLRQFEEDNPNYKLSRLGFFKWGKALLELPKKENDALKAFDRTFDFKDLEDGLTLPELHLWRGKARHKVGKRGYCEDWKKANKGGVQEAQELIKKFC